MLSPTKKALLYETDMENMVFIATPCEDINITIETSIRDMGTVQALEIVLSDKRMQHTRWISL